MPKLSGNKGEWSEIYTFLRLLETKTLYAADSDLNKKENIFYEILEIIRTEDLGNLEFRIDKTNDKQNHTISVFNTETDSELLNLSRFEFQRAADAVYREINPKNKKSSSFRIPTIENFLAKLHIGRIKAKSTDKADIKIRIHDIYTGYEDIQGFSIKSKLGSPSTLINASKATNFTFKITNIDNSLAEEINTRCKTFKEKFDRLRSASCTLAYATMDNSIFENNLLLIDGDLPKICAYMLQKYYSSRISSIQESLEYLRRENPLRYDLSTGHPFYQYKFKKFLTESALGMLPSQVWNGTADATGGYIIVKEDGDVLCYHLYNRNEFETYLIKNTKFETPSTSRHKFGSIYKENEEFFIKLNLQIRFN